VQPPAFLVARVARGTSLVTFEDDATASGDSSSIAMLAHRQGSSELASCCAKAKHCAHADEEARFVDQGSGEVPRAQAESQKPTSTKSVLLWDAVRKCKGIELAVKLISNSLVARGEQVLCPEPLLLFVYPLVNERLLSGLRQVEPPVP
jgi:hypothetical protein